MDAFIVCGLGFGDESKGKVSDAIKRRFGARAVFRYNGGPQSGHNIISPDGVWHCCSQFGAGSLDGAETVILHYMPVELEMLLAEAETLQAKGIENPFGLLTIDPRCIVITPAHKLVGQLREIMRGDHVFGSCGLGVGEAILDAEKGLSITIGDLFDSVNGERLLHRVLESKRQEAFDIPGVYQNSYARERMDFFSHRMQTSILYEEYARILECLSSRIDQDANYLRQCDSEVIVFEGAQGALLDRVHGFTPYVTKSRATWHNAGDLLADSNRRIRKIGVLRTYGHRHGAGPFVTEDARLLEAFEDPYNRENRWQGSFRVGEFDLIVMRYGLALNDGVDVLALTHLDRRADRGVIRVCTSYVYHGDAEELDDRFVWKRMLGHVVITAMLPETSSEYKRSMTEILFKCKPATWKMFTDWGELSHQINSFEDLPQNAQRFIRWLESPDGLNTSVGIVSYGPRSDQTLFLFD